MLTDRSVSVVVARALHEERHGQLACLVNIRLTGPRTPISCHSNASIAFMTSNLMASRHAEGTRTIRRLWAAHGIAALQATTEARRCKGIR